MPSPSEKKISVFLTREDLPKRNWMSQPYRERGSLAHFEKSKAPKSPQVRVADASGPKREDGGLASKPPSLGNVLQKDVLPKLKGKEWYGCQFDSIPLPGLGVVEMTIPWRVSEATCTTDDPLDYYQVFAGSEGSVPKASFGLYLEGNIADQHDCNIPLVQKVLSRLFVNGENLSANLRQVGMIPPKRLSVLPQTTDSKWVHLTGETLYIKENEGNFIYAEPPNESWGLKCYSSCGFYPKTQSVKPGVFMEIVPPSPWEEASRDVREHQALAEAKMKEYGNVVLMTCQQAENPEYVRQLFSKKLKESLAKGCKLVPSLCKGGIDKIFRDVQFALSGREARGIHTLADVFSPEFLMPSSWDRAKCSFNFFISGLQSPLKPVNFVPCGSSTSSAESFVHYRDSIIPKIDFHFTAAEGASVVQDRCSAPFVKRVLSKVLNTKTYGNDIQQLRQVTTRDIFTYYGPGEGVGEVLKGFAKSWGKDTWHRKKYGKVTYFANDFWTTTCSDIYFLENKGVLHDVSLFMHPLPKVHFDVLSHREKEQKKAQERGGKKLVTFDYKDVLRARKQEALAKEREWREMMKEAEKAELRRCREMGIPARSCHNTLLNLDSAAMKGKMRAEALCDSAHHQCTAICNGLGRDGFDPRVYKCAADCHRAHDDCKRAASY